MRAEIYVISGFLGAGKTTLIQKLLGEAFQKDKVVLIENDFGEISVDAALLKAGGITVREINSGCICCSLSGDFVKAILEITEKFRPDKIIIEPSGVGKLSDIVKACSDPRVQEVAAITAKVTVADVKRCRTYLDNFGEFFEDQIENADVIMLSRTEDYPDKVQDTLRLLKSLNAAAVIFAKPWRQICAEEIIFRQRAHHTHGSHPACTHEHYGHVDGHDHKDCGHGHSAEAVFDTVTIRTGREFTDGDIKACFGNLERRASGTVLRAKGIVRTGTGYVELQYLPGDLKISKCASSGDMVCIVGRDLNRRELIRLFNGE